MPKPNILFISSWYPSKEHQTLGNFVQKHAESINPLVNLRVLYITSTTKIQSKYNIDNSIINEVNTTIVYYKKVKIKIPILSQLIKLKRYLNAYKKGLNFIKTNTNFNQIDLTHCNITFQSSLFANYLKKRYKIPYIITEHSTVFSPYKNEYHKVSFLHKLLIKKGLKNANCIVPVSQQLKTAMQNLGFNNRYEVIGNVVDTTIFKPTKKLTPNKKPIILHISHMDNTQKNSEGMLNAIKIVSKTTTNFVFKIIADDNIENTNEIINSLNFPKGLIKLETTKSNLEIAQAYQTADFFILYSNFETFSVVLAEAWACGLPCIYSKCGGLTDINNPSLGVQIKPKNDTILAKKILEMLNNYSSFNTNEICKFATQFNSNYIGKAYLDTYKSILED